MPLAMVPMSLSVQHKTIGSYDKTLQFIIEVTTIAENSVAMMQKMTVNKTITKACVLLGRLLSSFFWQEHFNGCASKELS